MASFLRAKQSGVGTDLSAGLLPDDFALAETSFGLAGQIADVAYDPVQSLLAVGTRSFAGAPGRVYILGAPGVDLSFSLRPEANSVGAPLRQDVAAEEEPAGVVTVRFGEGRLVVLDSKNILTVFSIPEAKIVDQTAGLPSAGTEINSICVDPAVRYVFTGNGGDFLGAYDLKMGRYKQVTRTRLTSAVLKRTISKGISMVLMHPRNIGIFLVGTDAGAVVYSFGRDEISATFNYIQKTDKGLTRLPNLTAAAWHPTGVFVACGYDDGSIIFWDPKKGCIVAKSERGGRAFSSTMPPPVRQISWGGMTDPDDTFLIVSGGSGILGSERGIRISKLGRTPVYLTSSWEVLAQHLLSPQQTIDCDTPAGVEVVKFCPIPSHSPHFAGCQNPRAVLALFSSGEMMMLAFETGERVTMSKYLSVPALLSAPFPSSFTATQVRRASWERLCEIRRSGRAIVDGGSVNRPSCKGPFTNVVTTHHPDGAVRIWDGSSAGDISNNGLLQADVALAASKPFVKVSRSSLSLETGHLAVGLASGEFIVFKWGLRPQETSLNVGELPDGLSKIYGMPDRYHDELQTGFFPRGLFQGSHGAVTQVKQSDINLCAAGFEDGTVLVVDVVSLQVVYEGRLPMSAVSTRKKASMLLSRHGRKHSEAANPADGPTAPISCIEFSMMAYNEERKPSILLHVANTAGALATFKLEPVDLGWYKLVPVGSMDCDDSVLFIGPIDEESRGSACPTNEEVPGTHEKAKSDGFLVVATKSALRICKPVDFKGASRSVSTGIAAAGVVRVSRPGGTVLLAVACVERDRRVRMYGIPSLKELTELKLDKAFTGDRLEEAVVSPSGDVFLRRNISTVSATHVLRGTDVRIKPDIRVHTSGRTVPERPQISNVEWMSGTQHMTDDLMEKLVQASGEPSEEEKVRSTFGAAMVGQASGQAAALREGLEGRGNAMSNIASMVDSMGAQIRGMADEANQIVEKRKKNAVLSMFGL